MAGPEQRTEKSEGGRETGEAGEWSLVISLAASGGGGPNGRCGGKPRGSEGNSGLWCERNPIRGNGGLQLQQKILFLPIIKFIKSNIKTSITSQTINQILAS